MARPTDWDEPKERHQIRLTPTCWRHLDDIAAANDLPSRVEAIEHLSRYGAKNYVSFSRVDTAENYDEVEALKEAVLFHLVSTAGCAPDRLNPELILDSLKRLQEAFERIQPKN